MGSHITRMEDLEAECGRLRDALAAERHTASLNAECYTREIRALQDMVEAEAEARREAEGEVERVRDGLSLVTGQLRHAYTHLHAERVKEQRTFADGLIGPQIEKLERLARVPSSSKT